MKAPITGHNGHWEIRPCNFCSQPKPQPCAEAAKTIGAEECVRTGTLREQAGDLFVKSDIAAKNSFRTNRFSYRADDAGRRGRRLIGAGTVICFLLELEPSD